MNEMIIECRIWYFIYQIASCRMGSFEDYGLIIILPVAMVSFFPVTLYYGRIKISNFKPFLYNVSVRARKLWA